MAEAESIIGETPKPARPRIIEALLALAAEQPFDEITITEIAARAGVTLADFRDAFPSKGAALAGFSRHIDRIVLDGGNPDLAAEDSRERLFDVLMRRLEAMAPYRDGLRGVSEWLRRTPLAAAAVNQVVVNSMRFMLEAAGIESEGASGALKLQGLAMAWARILNVWYDDDDPGLAKTMAALDRELIRGERFVGRLDSIDRMAGPLKALTARFSRPRNAPAPLSTTAAPAATRARGICRRHRPPPSWPGSSRPSTPTVRETAESSRGRSQRAVGPRAPSVTGRRG